MFDNLSEELKTWSSNNALPNQTSYKFIAMQRSGADPYLGGGNITIEGHKSDDNHEWQKATTYYSGTKFIKFRDKLVGKWSDWEKVVFNSDLSMNLTVPNYSEAITLSDSISTYTAPSNGYIRSELIRTGTNITYWIIIQVNGVRVFIINGSDTTEMGVAFIPVSKGDVITWKFENSQYCKSIYNMFIPCK